MSTTSIARRYARALFELEQEGVKLADDLAAVAAVAGVDEVVAVLEQPNVPAETKVAILDKAAGGVSDEIRRLLHMLCERGKAVLLPEIAALFEDMQRQASSEVAAEVVTAVPLNEKMQARVADALGKSVGRKVRLSVSQDSDILGGLIVRIGDRQMDYSLRTRLEGLKRAMVS